MENVITYCDREEIEKGRKIIIIIKYHSSSGH